MLECIKHVDLWNAGYVEMWNFTKANSSIEARIEAVCEVAKTCRGVDNIKDSNKLYLRLLTEHAGHPSEIFSFIPYRENDETNMIDKRFAYKGMTNMRNIINPKSYDKSCEGFVVFKVKVPYMIVDHLRRHKLLSMMLTENWQSNRSKHIIKFFENDEVNVLPDDYGKPTINQKNNKCRQELLNKGEFGLRYVTGWMSGWIQDPLAWDNFFSVRTMKPTQKETMELAIEMQKMIDQYV